MSETGYSQSLSIYGTPLFRVSGKYREELSILEGGLSLPKRSFHFLDSETLSHKLSQRKAVVIKIIENVVRTIPEVLWKVALIDEVLRCCLSVKGCWLWRNTDVLLKCLAKLPFFFFSQVREWSLTLLWQAECKIVEIVYMLGKQPVITHVASES